MDPLTDAAAASGAGELPHRVVLSTERLLLCTWSPEHTDALFALSRDFEVMRWFPALATRTQVEQLVSRQQQSLATGRPGLHAVRTRPTEPGGSRCIGFVGLAVPTFEAAFTPCVEIGWRLERAAWGRGYATEAAREALRHGFETLGLKEVVSFTAVGNQPSRAVMRRLGMRHDPADDFDHPMLAPGHPLRRHVLYRLSAREWHVSRPDRARRD